MGKLLLTVVAVVALAGATAMAQTSAPNANANGVNTIKTDSGPNTPASGANSNGLNPPANAPRAAAQDALSKGPEFVNLQNSGMLSSNVVGLDIYNDQNNNIGQIHDIAFDASKKITGYILSVGGFLGIGTHYVSVDPSSVTVEYDANNKTWRATMNATKDQLKAAPEFKYGGQWTASRS
jgi:hypothetical protein